MLTAAAFAQVDTLATNRDGSVILLTSTGTVRQRGTDQPFNRKAFRLQNGALTLLDDLRLPLSGAYYWYYLTGSVSADGTVYSVNARVSCFSILCRNPEPRLRTKIFTPTRIYSFPGRSYVSSNGRFAAVYGDGSLALRLGQPREPAHLLDLRSGDLQQVGLTPADPLESVADDGTMLVFDRYDTALADSYEVTKLAGPSAAGMSFRMGYGSNTARQLSRDAARIVYPNFVRGDWRGTSYIHVIDTKTGEDRRIGEGESPSLAEDGRTFAFLRATPNAVSGQQLWIGDAVTGATRRVSTLNVGLPVIRGDGRAAIVLLSGGLVSIDTGTGAITQITRAPSTWLIADPVRGSYNELMGYASPDPPQLLIGDVAAVPLGPTPRGFAIQIPWEIPPSPTPPRTLLRGEEPLWEANLNQTLRDYAPKTLPFGTSPTPTWWETYPADAIHQDWSTFVDRQNPARPGEIVHYFGSGWGPVDGQVPTGQPTPADRIYRITLPCVWKARGSSSDQQADLEVLFAGLAPGMIGIYQLSVRIPENWRYPVFHPMCTWTIPSPQGESTGGALGAAIPVQP